jgi:hypothetical protein
MLGAAGPDRPRQQSLPCWRSFNPLFIQKSRINRATTRRAHRGGRRAGVEHWDGAQCTVRVGRPSVVWLFLR